MRKRKSNLKQIILITVVAIFTILAGVWTTKLTHQLEYGKSNNATPVVKINEDPKEITLSMVGDNLLHMPLIKNAENSDGTYNFDSIYEYMLPYFDEADLSVIVQETVLGGKELGYSGYPMFNSPQEVGDSLVNAGFDIILHATNHALDRGEKGIANTLNFWKKYPKIKVLGINETEEDYNRVNYIEKNGIKLAVLNYTDSTNGIKSPSNKPYIVNRADSDKIRKDLIEAENNADFTVVFMHWGTEYRFTNDDGQKALAKLMCDNGADLIMGSHPHVIEPAEWITSENGNKTLVYYSLGNFVSRQKDAANLLGALGSVKVCKTKDKGTYIDSASVMPIVTHYNVNSRGFKVYPLKDYTDELASQHGVAQYDGKVSKERFKKIFDDVFLDNTAVNIVY